MQITGRHYATSELVTLEISDRRIAAVTRADSARVTASPMPWVAPGFVDLQINGYGGQEFSSDDLTVEKVAEVVRLQGQFGVTRFCPTVTTASLDTLRHGLQTIAAACAARPDVAERVVGIHLEGPYLSPEDGARGAHPLEHCRRPNWEEFQKLQAAAGGRIRLLTLSAEFDESAPFIARAVSSGVVIAIGHTSADSAHIRAAVDAGATLSTHLGNGAHRELRRHPNYLWDQLAEDRLTASLIVDGHHLPAEVVKTFVRAKSPGRCILVSDVSGLAGLPPGVYSTTLCKLEILSTGRIVLAGQNQLLAAASLPIGVGVANVMRFAGVSLSAAIDMASYQPAALMRQPGGRLMPGEAADLVLFDLPFGDDGLPTGLNVRATLTAGRFVYGSAEQAR